MATKNQLVVAEVLRLARTAKCLAQGIVQQAEFDTAMGALK